MGSTSPLMLTLPILARMRAVGGWLEDEEADLLVTGASRALAELPGPHAIVEVGSFCGRATVVLGSVAMARDPTARVYAVDRFDGEVGALDQGIERFAPSLAAFERNIAQAGLRDVVTTVQQAPCRVDWETPIAFLLIDGLHDYASVSADFFHFEPWLPDGAYVAFHDYADYFPGVMAFVDELLAAGPYLPVRRVNSMTLLRKRAA